MNRPKTCGFTGYRPSKLPFPNNEKHPACLRLKASLRDAVESAIKDGYTHFIYGFALGSDTYFAEAVLDFTKRVSADHPGSSTGLRDPG